MSADMAPDRGNLANYSLNLDLDQALAAADETFERMPRKTGPDCAVGHQRSEIYNTAVIALLQSGAFKTPEFGAILQS
jgi:hypothetical protein